MLTDIKDITDQYRSEIIPKRHGFKRYAHLQIKLNDEKKATVARLYENFIIGNQKEYDHDNFRVQQFHQPHEKPKL